MEWNLLVLDVFIKAIVLGNVKEMKLSILTLLKKKLM